MPKNILITGATAGFGEATAERFAKEGHNVIITGRRQERLTSIAKKLTEQYGVKVLPLCFDVQNRQQVFEVIAGIPDEWKKIDVLVNNAGLALGRAFFDEADLDDWDTMIDTNVKGLLYVSKAVIPLMTAVNKGHIINIGSVAGKEIYEKGNVYCGTKFAVKAISKSMRIDLLRYGIKVTAIHPGAADTEFSTVRFHGDTEKAAETYTGMKPLTGADVAEVIYYTTTLPDHVCINDLVLTPLQQADAIFIHRK